MFNSEPEKVRFLPDQADGRCADRDGLRRNHFARYAS